MPSRAFVRSLLLTLLVGPLLAGCFSSGEAAERERTRSRRGPANELQNQVVRTYLTDHPAASAYDIVRQLRPAWLQRRSPNTTVWAYEGGIRVGDANRYLRGVDLESVERIVFLDANTATTRYGLGHEEGAIVIHYRFR